MVKLLKGRLPDAGLGKWLVGLSRSSKRLILIANDFVLLVLALWLAMSFRLNELYVPPSTDFALLLLAAPVIGVATIFWLGLYRLVTRYSGADMPSRLAFAIGLSVLLWALVVLMSGMVGVPRSVVVLYGLVAFALLYVSRRLVGFQLRWDGPAPRPAADSKAVVVYGAGATGMQLLEALQRSGSGRPVGVLDETGSLKGQYVAGVKVYPPDKLAKLIEREGVKDVILALPEAQRRHRQEILKWLQHYPVRVRTVPSMEDFAAGRVEVSDLRPVDVEDLLGRDPVPPVPGLLPRSVTDKVVMVTGAGGSIGSELVRQVLKQGPARLVLFELSEVALYEIEMDVRERIAAQPAAAHRPEVHAVLGSVQDEAVVRGTIAKHEVATIFHAAAYKHVPIVEFNPIAGLSNNTFGTAVVAEAARQLGVERVVLISTDKAVRPTNVMGASKRLAELVLQAHAAEPGCETVFTMVRFGNVLDSSGSVVRRFRKQIQAGGPVTVTHRDMTRYFMSIPEAAELVIQAGAMARGGEVFVLEMGEAVKIDELARSMIRLMGLDVKDESHPNGDVAISYIGLREGEKLKEELLLHENTSETEHPRIMRNNEPLLTTEELNGELEALRAAMAQGDMDAIQAILMRTVEGYRPDSAVLTGDGRRVAWEAASRALH
jgi:FlaA1/EpsC-like NDP-sugar epimerase